MAFTVPEPGPLKAWRVAASDPSRDMWLHYPTTQPAIMDVSLKVSQVSRVVCAQLTDGARGHSEVARETMKEAGFKHE